MEYAALYHWFFTFWAFVYGLLIGSFLNVCIYRLPPKIYVFEDLLFKEESDFVYYGNKLLYFLKLKKEESTPILEPSLYAEGVFHLIISPETVTHLAAAHNFNLFRAFNPDPVNIVKPRSFCPNCKNMIRWWMNIPVLSYLFLGRKCYYCKIPISPRYMINELITGFLLGALFYVHGFQNPIVFIYYSILICICIVVFYIDLEHWVIMDEITLPFSMAGVLGSLFIPVKFFFSFHEIFFSYGLSEIIPAPLVSLYNSLVSISPSWIFPGSFLHSFFGAVLGFSFLWAIGVVGKVMLKRDAMGGGDVKFAMLMGAFLGPLKGGLAFFMAVFLGTFILLPMLILNRKTGKDQVPFGCFLTAATVITVFFGDKFIWYYLNAPALMFGF